ncbi:hypothetical protein SNEBB_010593, partial [Seison nebaliae]
PLSATQFLVNKRINEKFNFNLNTPKGVGVTRTLLQYKNPTDANEENTL